MVAECSSPVSAPSTPTADRAARTALSREEARRDVELVRRFNAGDEAAFVTIVTHYRAKMQQVALRLLRNRADAEEIAQDTFIRAHRGLARFRGDSSLAAWLYRIALNLSRNRYWYHFRRRRYASLPLDAVCNKDHNGTLAELVASNAPSPVQEATTNEFAAIVTGCMHQLSASQREILMLRNVQQHSYHRISHTLGIRVGTAKSRIARARTSLRLLLGKAYPEFAPDTSPTACFEPLRCSGRLEVACV